MIPEDAWLDVVEPARHLILHQVGWWKVVFQQFKIIYLKGDFW